MAFTDDKTSIEGVVRTWLCDSAHMISLSRACMSFSPLQKIILSGTLSQSEP